MIHTHNDDRVFTIAVDSLDQTDADEFGKALSEAVSSHATTVTVNLGSTSELDSAFVALLRKASSRLSNWNSRLVLQAESEQLMSDLVGMGLQPQLEIH